RHTDWSKSRRHTPCAEDHGTRSVPPTFRSAATGGPRIDPLLSAGASLFAVFSPALAAGAAAAAVAVPLVIHLLFRKRYQIVPWAAVRFLLVAERRHRRRIDQWLLLALRTLALLLPLFAMAATTRWAEGLWQSIRPG